MDSKSNVSDSTMFQVLKPGFRESEFGFSFLRNKNQSNTLTFGDSTEPMTPSTTYGLS